MFGTEKYPLRCSALPDLVKCPMKAKLQYDEFYSGGSSASADTGTAVHYGIELFHQRKEVQEATRMMENALPESFPKADLEEAVKQFQAYAEDPRNQVEVPWLEVKIKFILPPHRTDPTGLPIHITGKLDQIRRENGELYLWDVKTGAYESGGQMLNSYAVQLAAYAYGASKCLGTHVKVGGIIATKDYRRKTQGPVFWEVPWKGENHGKVLMSTVAKRVAEIRSGEALPHPGSLCNFCSFGLSSCLGRIEV